MEVSISFLEASHLLAQAIWMTVRACFALCALSWRQCYTRPPWSGHWRLRLSRTLTLGLARAPLTLLHNLPGSEDQGLSGCLCPGMNQIPGSRGGGKETVDSQYFSLSTFPSWVLDFLVPVGPFGKAHRPAPSMFLVCKKYVTKKTKYTKILCCPSMANSSFFVCDCSNITSSETSSLVISQDNERRL